MRFLLNFILCNRSSDHSWRSVLEPARVARMSQARLVVAANLTSMWMLRPHHTQKSHPTRQKLENIKNDSIRKFYAPLCGVSWYSKSLSNRSPFDGWWHFLFSHRLMRNRFLSSGVNLLIGTESELMLLDRSGQGKVYQLISRRRFQQMEVLEGQNILITISGKKNRVRVYYLSWLKSKILRTDGVCTSISWKRFAFRKTYRLWKHFFLIAASWET